ncbi:hypothetical protein ACFO5R_01955 [Halosolutus amylolyticus]|uniref:Uncharacterized protein n=1 Tax=Halosolutus amylolyticus TaxID=2932267 RepID=A0ABD5PL96_9EURY|nr:hypothetical protein [Halosolutus amylolyticus]
MNRRSFLGVVTASAVATAGCLGDETVVDESVEEETVVSFDADANATIDVTLRNDRGRTAAAAVLRGLDAGHVVSLDTQSGETVTVEGLSGGAYYVVVIPDEEASVEVSIVG